MTYLLKTPLKQGFNAVFKTPCAIRLSAPGASIGAFLQTPPRAFPRGHPRPKPLKPLRYPRSSAITRRLPASADISVNAQRRWPNKLHDLENGAELWRTACASRAQRMAGAWRKAFQCGRFMVATSEAPRIARWHLPQRLMRQCERKNASVRMKDYIFTLPPAKPSAP